MGRLTRLIDLDKFLDESAVGILHYRSACYAEISIYGTQSQYSTVQMFGTQRDRLRKDNCPSSRMRDLQVHSLYQSETTVS
jgi:hypothetical protein